MNKMTERTRTLYRVLDDQLQQLSNENKKNRNLQRDAVTPYIVAEWHTFEQLMSVSGEWQTSLLHETPT